MILNATSSRWYLTASRLRRLIGLSGRESGRLWLRRFSLVRILHIWHKLPTNSISKLRSNISLTVRINICHAVFTVWWTSMEINDSTKYYSIGTRCDRLPGTVNGRYLFRPVGFLPRQLSVRGSYLVNRKGGYPKIMGPLPAISRSISSPLKNREINDISFLTILPNCSVNCQLCGIALENWPSH